MQVQCKCNCKCKCKCMCRCKCKCKCKCKCRMQVLSNWSSSTRVYSNILKKSSPARCLFNVRAIPFIVMRPTLKKPPFPPKGHQARPAPRLMSISSCHLLCITGPSTKRSPGAPSRPIALHLLNGDEQSADLSRSFALSSLNICRNRGVKIFHRNENFRRERGGGFGTFLFNRQAVSRGVATLQTFGFYISCNQTESLLCSSDLRNPISRSLKGVAGYSRSENLRLERTRM